MTDIGSLVLVAIVLALVLVGGLVLAVVLRGERGRAELAARLAQLADSQTRAETRLAQSLLDHERAVGDRLGDLTRRVGESLEKTSEKTQATMTDLRERLAKIDVAQHNITELSNQMVSLQDILANKQARGAFGEIQLKDLVTSVLPASAYEFQAQIGDGKRVDCLLRLPNPPGSIGIDAKFPLEPYNALMAAATEADKTRAARDLRTAMTAHITAIRDKYIVPGETAEWAVMFLPSEAVFSELHANFRDVVEAAHRARVGIVSPGTLWATLITIRAVLKDVQMREQAGEIQKQVRAMLEDVLRLDDRVGKLQRHFDQATEDVRQIRVSTEKITKRAERIEEIEVEEIGAEAESAEVASFAPPPKRLGGEG